MLTRRIAATVFAVTIGTLGFSQEARPGSTPYGYSPEPVQHYTETDLVSNISGKAAVTDPNAVNVWGLSRSSSGPWWVSDNGTGLSTLYLGDGTVVPLVVKIPAADAKNSSTGSPTGTVFNATNDFQLDPGLPSVFLFATEDGTISGWNPGRSLNNAILLVNEGTASVFKGLAIGQASVKGGPLKNYLYAANFRAGKVSVYGTGFVHNTAIEAAFAKVSVSGGYAPFNVQNLGGNIYVTYAKQDAAKHDEVDGAGLGFVAVFHPDGTLIQVLQMGNWFNAPWGVAIAPSDFGAYSHDVLVGNFGSGEIAAFDPVTGAFKGLLRDAKNQPIQIDGLWGLSVGNDGKSGAATSVYFGAGPNREQDGLLGRLTAVENNFGGGQ